MAENSIPRLSLQSRPSNDGPAASSSVPRPEAPGRPRPMRTHSHQQPNLFVRLTTKLRSRSASVPRRGRSPSPPPSSSADSPMPVPVARTPSASPHPDRRRPPNMRMPLPPRAGAIPNGFTSPDHQKAALRAAGLVPASAQRSPYRDMYGYFVPLSEQEAALDQQFSVIVEAHTPKTPEGESEADRVRAAWRARNSLERIRALENERLEREAEENDAIERAKEDGVLRDARRAASPALWVDGSEHTPSIVELSEYPIDAAGSPSTHRASYSGSEDFHTAPNTPGDHTLQFELESVAEHDECDPAEVALPPSEPPTPDLSRSNSIAGGGDLSAQVSRWMHSSTGIPTPLSTDTSTLVAESLSGALAVWAVNGRSLSEDSDVTAHNSPAATIRARPRVEKPSPLSVVTQQAPDDAPEAQTRSDGTEREGEGQVERGRPAVATPPPMAKSSSTVLPALSPARSVSSAGGASSLLNTPSSASCAPSSSQHDVSSTARSFDSGHQEFDVIPSAKEVLTPKAFPVEGKPAETGTTRTAAPPPLGGAPPAPERRVSQESPAPRQRAVSLGVMKRRLSMFGKRPNLSVTPPTPEPTPSPPPLPSQPPSNSKSNIRRAFSKLQPRPKSTIVVTIPPPSATADEPKSPRLTSPSVLSFMSAVSSGLRSPRATSFRMPTPRSPTAPPDPAPRQAVSPTMHTSSSIAHLLHHGGVEDEESRRLSEAAFLT